MVKQMLKQPSDVPHNLERFVKAQSLCCDRACRELTAGQKQTHWMWYIFPQLRGLGHSATSYEYGIASRSEAEAYAAHPLLGARLRDCTQLVILIQGRSIEQIFGYPDDLKFRSSMTLFARTASENDIFLEALQQYFAGKPDPLTIRLLAESASH